MRAVFMRKEPEIDTKEFQVEKVITLPSEQYAYFTQHLMKEHDFIKENNSNGVNGRPYAYVDANGMRSKTVVDEGLY